MKTTKLIINIQTHVLKPHPSSHQSSTLVFLILSLVPTIFRLKKFIIQWLFQTDFEVLAWCKSDQTKQATY